MTRKQKTSLVFGGLSLCVLTASLFSCLSQITSNNLFGLNASASNEIVLSSSRQVVDSIAYTTKGASIWFKGDASSGITWNNGSNQVAIAKGGYIQNLTAINGLQKVSVNLVSGSLDLYYDYKEPQDCETPMYYTGKTFTSTGSYTFSSNLPSRIRLRAAEDTVINSITINYDCQTVNSDSNLESLDSGLENSYIDAGTIAKYANTSYVVGDGNVASDDSTRALRIDFKNTTNNYVSFNTEKNTKKGIAGANPDFTNSIFTFKAKLSENIRNTDLSACAIGTGWETSTYIPMIRSESNVDGWYTYSVDFADLNYTGANSIIRINVRAEGIDSLNKDSAYVLIDNVEYKEHTKSVEFSTETMADGLENMCLDSGWQSVDTKFDNQVKFGRSSKASLACTPRADKSGTSYFMCLAPEYDTSISSFVTDDWSTGTLSFYYKPICTKNKKITLKFWKDWDTNVSKEISGTYVRDGWYHGLCDLNSVGYTSIIRLQFYFDIESGNKSCSKVYFDNIRIIDQNKETLAQGLENLPYDTGLSAGNDRTTDYGFVASDTSINSVKAVINGSNVTAAWQNKYGVIFNTQNADIPGMTMNQGVLECKFYFQGDFPTKKLWLRAFDSSWNGATFKDVPTTKLNNGWYQARIDFSTLSSWPGATAGTASFKFNEKPIRIGFGYQDLDAEKLTNKTVWIDDMFYYPSTSTPTSVDLWQAYNTENILQDATTLSGRAVTTENPLYISNVRNTVDSTQLMIKSTSAISSYSFRPGLLRSDSGDYIGADQFEILIAKYQHLVDSNEKTRTGHQGDGYYPDALIPQDKLIAKGENTIAAGNQQAIWINCSIAKDQLPGVYTGNGILTLNGTEYTIPMKVKVFNAEISDKNNLQSSFLIWDDQTSKYESTYTANMRAHIYKWLLNKRIAPSHLYDWSRYTRDGLDKYHSYAENIADYVLFNDKISNYRLPIDTESTTTVSTDYTGYLTALAEKNIELWNEGYHVNIFDKLYAYLTDEPEAPEYFKREPDVWKELKSYQSSLNSAKSSISSSLLGDYPEIRAGLNSVHDITTINKDYTILTKWNDLLTSTYINTPCPEFDKLDTQTLRNNYNSKFNNYVWWYGCVSPKLPYPSYHIDTGLLGQRMIPWMTYQYGIKGEVYWSVNCFDYFDDGELHERNIYTEPIKGDSTCVGDGYLIYPGKDYDVYGPITSMRMENIRNGRQDYEIFMLIDQYLANYNSKTGSSISSCIDLISSETANMYSGTQLKTGAYNMSGYHAPEFNTFREYLLTQLEIAYN